MTFAFSSLRLRAVAIVTIAAMIAWSLGLPTWIHTAGAANVSNMSDTLSTSEPSVGAQHSIAFVSATLWSANDRFRIYFDPDTQLFDISAIDFADISVTGASGFVNGAVGCNGIGDNQIFWEATDATNDFIQFGVCALDTIAASTSLTFDIGTSDTVTNPATTTSYVIRLAEATTTGVSIPDSGDTRVAIVDTVTVTAAVETTFTFTVTGTTSGVTINDEPVATVDSTTATSVAFGTVSPGAGNAEFLAQRLGVDTNAQNGFTVTVFADQTLLAGNGADIDTFYNGDNRATTSLWASPSNTFGTENTYGHWGVTSDDNDVGSSTIDYGAGVTNYLGNFVNNAIPVFYHNGPADDTNAPTAGQSFAHVGYKIEIGTLQEAANDYTSTLTYVATPVF